MLMCILNSQTEADCGKLLLVNCGSNAARASRCLKPSLNLGDAVQSMVVSKPVRRRGPGTQWHFALMSVQCLTAVEMLIARKVHGAPAQKLSA